MKGFITKNSGYYKISSTAIQMKKVLCLIFFIVLFNVKLFSTQKAKGFTLDFFASTGIGLTNCKEFVYVNSGDVLSELSWKQSPHLLSTLGISLNLKIGFSCFASINFVHKKLPTNLVDKDFINSVVFSYSKHPVKINFSGDICSAIGWKFLVYASKEKKYLFFLEPMLKVDYYFYNYTGYNGFAYKINKYGSKYDNMNFTGNVINYKMRLFSTQLLLNMHTQINDIIELKAGFSIGFYSKAIALDHHILRNIKFYDQFNFFIFLTSLNFSQKYNITEYFGLFSDIDFILSKSKKGSTIAQNTNNGTIQYYQKGSSGFQFLRFNFSFGIFFRVGKLQRF